MDILKDYLTIYQQFPAHSTWKKAERKERHRQLMEWVKCPYNQLPDISDIISVMESEGDAVFEQPFISKVLAPCVRRDIENQILDAVRFLFESNDESRIGSTRDNIHIFCNACDWAYTPVDLENFILNLDPENLCVLRYKYHRMKRFIGFSIHEVPWGVLNGMNGAEKAAIPEMQKDLDKFNSLCKMLGKDEEQLIHLCRGLYGAWAEYLEQISSFDGFQDYLEQHHIKYE